MFLNYRNQEMAFNRYIILIIVAVLSLAPFIYMLLVSFMTLGEATNIKILLPSELRLKIMQRLGNRPGFPIISSIPSWSRFQL